MIGERASQRGEVRERVASDAEQSLFWSAPGLRNHKLNHSIAFNNYVQYYPCCTASFLSCIPPVLRFTCPEFIISCITSALHPLDLSCILSVLLPSCPASLLPSSILSCNNPVLHPSCPAFILSCIHPSCNYPVLHLSCPVSIRPATILSCIYPALHPSWLVCILSCIYPALCPSCIACILSSIGTNLVLYTSCSSFLLSDLSPVFLPSGPANLLSLYSYPD